MIKITKQKRNELLQRDEISALKDDAKTPVTSEMQAEIASLLKKDISLIVVKKIRGSFGSRQFLVEANVYDSEDIKNKIEPKVKLKKEAGAAPADAQSSGKGNK